MQLTKNFSLAEFACKDGTPVPGEYVCNVKELADQIQALREYLGGPLTVMSSYRTPAHNKKVGGAKNSQHLTASAADLKSPNHTPKQIKAAIEKLIAAGKMKQGGVGLYPTFVHYDIRGKKARW